MRHLHSSLISAFALAIAAPAAAQSTGFYYNGYAALDYAHSSGGGGGFTAGLIDMSFGIAPNSSDSFGGVGFEAGVWAYGREGSSSEAVGYAALTFALGGGVLHVGAPRSAVRGYNTTPFPTGARAALFEIGLYSGATPMSASFSATYDRPILGVLYERESGPLRYSASFGQMNNGVGINVLGLGVERDLGDARIFGTLEHLWASGGEITTAVVGGSTQLNSGSSSLGAIEVGGAVSYMNQAGTTVTSATVFGTASMTDRLDVTAAATYIGLGGGQTIYGLNGSYDLWSGVRLNAGVGASSSGGNTIWTVGLSRDF